MPREDKHLNLEVLVNGKSHGALSFSANMLVEAFIAEALAKTKNVGQPPQNWTARDGAGNLLDVQKHLSATGLTDGAQVWLDLKAGAAGR